MMKGLGAKDAKECSRKCAQLRMKYVLYDPATKAIYEMDDQEKAATYAGQKVAVKGALDAGSKTIRVESVEAQ
jgi:hypothetical protein